MTEVNDRITALLAAPADDVTRLEHTLTDGYAHALTLEAERGRLERRVGELTRGLEHGDVSRRVHELSEIVKRLDDTASELSELRGLLSRLRRHADEARVGSPPGSR